MALNTGKRPVQSAANNHDIDGSRSVAPGLPRKIVNQKNE